MAEKILVNATYGTDDVERATVPFVVSSASAASDNDTVVFMTAQSVHLATKGGANGVQSEGYPAIADLIAATIENGGKIWVCPACASANGISWAGSEVSSSSALEPIAITVKRKKTVIWLLSHWARPPPLRRMNAPSNSPATT